jgi:hypothetical protein
VISFTPQPLYILGKSRWYPLDRRLGGPQSRSGRGGEEKNSQPLPGIEPPIIQPIAQRYTSELTRFNPPDSEANRIGSVQERKGETARTLNQSPRHEGAWGSEGTAPRPPKLIIIYSHFTS